MDYATVSHKSKLSGLMSVACLPQGDSNVGHMEDNILSVPSSEE